jgi:hypothetical protein
MYFSDYKLGDSFSVAPDEDLSMVSEYESSSEFYLRSFYSEEADTPFAVAMVSSIGEVGLLVSSIPESTKDFYTLFIVFSVEAFAFAGTDALYTGFDPNARDTRWKRFLGMQVTEEQWPEHTERGLVTHHFPLTNWVR